jgi:PAS domain-containing protein
VAAQERLAFAVEGSHDGFWYWDLQSNSFHCSPAWEALLRFEPGEVKSHPDEWLDRVHPGYLAELQKRIAAHLLGDTDQFRSEHRLRRKIIHTFGSPRAVRRYGTARVKRSR